MGLRISLDVFSERVDHIISEYAIRLTVYRRYTRHHKRILRTTFAGIQKYIVKLEGSRDVVKHR